MEEAKKQIKTESDTNLLQIRPGETPPRKPRGYSVRIAKRPITCHRSYTSKYSSSPDKIK